jgi:hypothetical protein
MSRISRTKSKEIVRNWAVTGSVLERLRIEEYRRSDLSEILLSLSDITHSSLIAHPPKPYSGVVEMQRLFAKMKR